MDQRLRIVLDELNRRQTRRTNFRVLRDRSNPFELPEEVFRQMYRLNSEAANELFQDLLPYLNNGSRITRTPPIVRFFTTIHFLAHGSYQKSLGVDYLNGSSQSNVSRSIHEVVNVMVDHLINRHIRFPQNDEDKGVVKNNFYRKFHVPGIVGCIDCTHIKIVPPSFGILGYPPNVFINRKNFHSINCQIICDGNCNILSINAQFPGSVHDAAIWRMSNVKNFLHRRFIDGDQGTYLIGDAGYPLLPYLLTPVVGAAPNTPQGRYTQRHQQIRNCIERTNGMLKGVWRCLNSDRVLHYNPAFVSRIVYACAMLHNIIIRRNIPINENLILLEDDNFDDEDDIGMDDAQLLNRGNIVRNRIINNFFN